MHQGIEEAATCSAGRHAAPPDPAVIARCLYVFFYQAARLWCWIVGFELAVLDGNVAAAAVPAGGAARAAVWVVTVILLSAAAGMLAGSLAAAIARRILGRITRDAAWQQLFGSGAPA